MIGICPSCGATHSAEAWLNDLLARKALKSIAEISGGLAEESLRYLSLFRPEKRALSWKKAQGLLVEVQALIAPGYVQIQGKPARTCPPSLWAQGMEQMVERAATLSRPVKNHNYLRQVVWQLADQADSRGETQRRSEETNGTARARRQSGEDMSAEARKYVDKFGEPELPKAVAESLARVKAKMQQGGTDHA